jgi:hypothetical protein
MTENAGNPDDSAMADWERFRDEVACRVGARPLPWPVKVEIWEQEVAESEATFCRVLKRCGMETRESESEEHSFLLGEMPEEQSAACRSDDASTPR